MMRPLKLKAQCVVYDHWSHYGGVHVPCLIPMFLMGFPIWQQYRYWNMHVPACIQLSAAILSLVWAFT